MFHHYSENSSSTGEPPTPPSENVSSALHSEPSLSSANMDSNVTSQTPPNNRDSSQSLSVIEPDSGYEASPNSITDNSSSQHFFGEQSTEVAQHATQSSRHTDEEIEFLDCQSPLLYSDSDSESDMEDWDTCPDCNSAASCECFRTDSSTTNVISAISNCDNSRSNSSDFSSTRPSSQPVQIPDLHARGIRTNSIVVDPHIDLRLQAFRSQPLDVGRMQAVGFVNGTHPLSWPSTNTPWRIQRSAVALPLLLSNLRTCWNMNIPNRLRASHRRRPIRSRRQIIDSDASSLCSSDEEGPEEVFNMSGEGTSASFSLCPMVTDGSVPLPDVVPQSPDSRRNRSISVNIPPQPEQLRSIGNALRRLSNEFERNRQIALATRSRRRQTVGSISQLNGIS